jgi:hypothetical protein
MVIVEKPSTLPVRIDYTKLMTEEHALFLPFSTIDCFSCRTGIINDNHALRAQVDWINVAPDWP